MKHSPSSSGDFGLFGRLLDSWTDTVLDSADWKLNFGSWVRWPPPTDGLFTRRHKEPWFLLFLFFNSLHGLFGSSSSSLTGSFVGTLTLCENHFWAAETCEHARRRLSALAPGRITSLSLISENRTPDRTTPCHTETSGRFLSLGNKVHKWFSLSWKWSVSSLGGLLFCRGAAAVLPVDMMNLATRLLLNCESFKANLLFISYSTLVN